MDPKRPLPHNVLQEYLEALATPGTPPHPHEKKLISWAELQYRLHGGGRCTMCHAAVRHVLPVRAEHLDGTIAEYRCLCLRCLNGEKVVSRKVILTVGAAVVEYRAEERAEKPATRKFRAAE